MKKAILSLGVLATLSLFSCGEVCTTCTVSYELAGQTVEVPQQEFCSTNALVKEYKDGIQDVADELAEFAGGANATATCVDN